MSLLSIKTEGNGYPCSGRSRAVVDYSVMYLFFFGNCQSEKAQDEVITFSRDEIRLKMRVNELWRLWIFSAWNPTEPPAAVHFTHMRGCIKHL